MSRFRVRMSALMAVAATVAMVGLWVYAQREVPARSGVGPINRAEPDKVEVGKPGITGMVAQAAPATPPLEQLKVGGAVATSPREIHRVQLPDGSRVALNAGTAIRLEADRELILERGEIFVEVEPASERFLVKTPAREVVALGTKFAVRHERDKTGVVVTQGKVQVSGIDRVVQAGQQLMPDSSEPAESPRATAALDWARDLLAGSPLVPGSKFCGGAIVAFDRTGQEAKISLNRFHLDVHIEDGFARTTIDQTYFNHDYNQLEGTFYFPLPADASISRLAMYVNGQLMEGGMADRDHARNTFEQIRYTRRDPALLEWMDGSTFKMRVFPLEPRQEKRILLSYTQRLPNLHGKASYRFPLGHNLPILEQWSVNVVVKGGAALPWKCTTHLLDAKQNRNDLLLTAQAKNVKPSRDLQLDVTDTGPAAAGVRFAATVHEGQRYVGLRFRPELKAGTANAKRKHYFVLFETSADRDPLLARTQIEVLRTVLENLEHDDTFAILAAGTRTRWVQAEPVAATPKNVDAALEKLESAHLIGALDLGLALNELAPVLKETKNSCLIHLGSGVPVLGEKRDDVLISKLPAETMYAGIAIGKRWNRTLMKAAAERSGGHYTQIHPDEPVSWRAFDFLGALQSPRLQDVKVTDDAGRSWLLQEPSVSAGEELFAVTGHSAKVAAPSKVTVTGRVMGEKFEQSFQIDAVADGGYLPRTWGKFEIDRLMADGAEKHKATIAELSKRLYVMSPFTSLLVLENDAMYSQFNIDRGRKDHWARYEAPATMPVVKEKVQGPPPQTSTEQVLRSIIVRNAQRPLTLPGAAQTGSRTAWDLAVAYADAGLVQGISDGISNTILGSGDQTEILSEAIRKRISESDPKDRKEFENWKKTGLSSSHPVRDVRGGLPSFPYQPPIGGPGTIRPGFAPPVYYSFGGGLGGLGGGGLGGLGGGGLGGLGGGGLGGLGGGGLGGGGFGGIGGSFNGFSGLGGFGGGFNGQQGWAIPGGMPGPMGPGFPGGGFPGGPPPGMPGMPGMPGGPGMPAAPFVPNDPVNWERDVRASIRNAPRGTNGADELTALQKRTLRGIDKKMAQSELSKSPDELRIQLMMEFDRVRGIRTGLIPEDFSLPGKLGDLTSEDFGDRPYRHPIFQAPADVGRDLLAFAPGMDTMRADVLAALAKEAGLEHKPGKIDPEARRLIDRARSIGWRKLWTSGDSNVLIDGEGRCVIERTLPLGLKELILGDGSILLHLYPEIGVGARRWFSRFHLDELRDHAPWLLPSADDLARGCELKAVDARTVAVVPPVSDKPHLELWLVFSDDGRLAERQIVSLPEKKVVHSRKFSDKEYGKPAPAPSLNPDLKKIVVLPLPYRTAQFAKEWETKFGGISFCKAGVKDLQHASALAEMKTGMQNTSVGMFTPDREKWHGALTILRAGGMLAPAGAAANNSDSLGRYWQWWSKGGVKAPADTNPSEHLLQPVTNPIMQWMGFAPKQAPAYSYLQRIADLAYLVQEPKMTMSAHMRWLRAFVERNPNELTVAAIIHTSHRPEMNADHWMTLSELWSSLNKHPAFGYAARYERIRCLVNAGYRSAAQIAFEDLCKYAVENDLPLRFDGAIQSLRTDNANWHRPLETVARAWVKKSPERVLALANQCAMLGQTEAAKAIFAVAKPHLAEAKPAVRLAAAMFALHYGKPGEAQGMLQPLLEDKEMQQSPALWRLAAGIAQQRRQTRRYAESMERALDLEFAWLPETIDVQILRAEYGGLLEAYRQLIDAMRQTETEIPADMKAKIVRAVDRWRSLDPDSTIVCFQAARLMRELESPDLAWEYVTSPLASQPNDANPLRRLAAELTSTGEDVLAERALAAAFQVEPTDAQLLWDRAHALQRLGRHVEAQAVLKQIATGTWQPRFEGLKQQAAQSIRP